jgi:hypothetical protein
MVDESIGAGSKCSFCLPLGWIRLDGGNKGYKADGDEDGRGRTGARFHRVVMSWFLPRVRPDLRLFIMSEFSIALLLMKGGVH